MLCFRFSAMFGLMVHTRSCVSLRRLWEIHTSTRRCTRILLALLTLEIGHFVPLCLAVTCPVSWSRLMSTGIGFLWDFVFRAWLDRGYMYMRHSRRLADKSPGFST